LSIEATYRKTAALIATISSADCEKLSTHLSLLFKEKSKFLLPQTSFKFQAHP
jgi:hypothetical protein